MPQQTAIKIRRGTAANWQGMNPILMRGEPGYEVDTRRIKIGDGVKPWNELEYLAGAPSLHVGEGPPAADTGEPGHTYIDRQSGLLYGPKTASGWPAGVSLKGPKGDTGPQGVQGVQGATGAAGATGTRATRARSGRKAIPVSRDRRARPVCKGRRATPARPHRSPSPPRST